MKGFALQCFGDNWKRKISLNLKEENLTIFSLNEYDQPKNTFFFFSFFRCILITFPLKIEREKPTWSLEERFHTICMKCISFHFISFHKGNTKTKQDCVHKLQYKWRI